jgi:hypothetical protein
MNSLDVIGPVLVLVAAALLVAYNLGYNAAIRMYHRKIDELMRGRE